MDVAHGQPDFSLGILGGLVGTQGGIRAVALLGFELSKETFVATATAVALIVDGIRAPIYLVSQWKDLIEIWPLNPLGNDWGRDRDGRRGARAENYS